MAAWVLPALQGVASVASMFGANAARKKATRAAEAAEREAESRRVGYASESPNEMAQRAMWTRVAQQYAGGAAPAAEQAASDRTYQVAAARRGRAGAAATQSLSDYLARRGESGSAAGLARLAAVGADQRRDEDEAAMLERAAQHREMVERVARGYSMIGEDLDRGYRNRALLASGAPGPSMARSRYYDEQAAGYEDLGGELLGRSLYGLEDWWNKKGKVN